jgi:hypothetical protein
LWTGKRLSSENEGNQEFVIFVNKKQLKVNENNLTGQRILQLAGFDVSQYDLFLVKGESSEQIQPGQSVEIKNGLHFNAILKNVPYGDRNDS